jgi:Mrp family chromosome partitioning ATPase
MERIQAAIQKAKEARGTLPPAAPPRPAKEARGPRPAERPAGPLWAEITPFTPDPAVLRANRIVTFQRGDPVHATFDMMRTKTLRMMRDKGWTSLGITSPTAGCGKTTVGLNLAFSFAHQSDTRTVLMDLDLRRPAVAKHLGLDRPQSMASVLQGTRGFAENFVRTGDNLAIGTSARGIRSASEILQHAVTERVLADLRAGFQPNVIIFDLPPMLVNDDVLAFLPHVDCVLLVAAAERSRLDEIDKCEQDLADQSNVLGVILNKCRYPGEDYGYY